MNGKKIIGMNECKNDQKRLEKEQNHQIKRNYALWWMLLVFSFNKVKKEENFFIW